MNGPEDGVATLHLDLPEDAKVGDTVVVEIEVTDPSRIEPFLNRAELRIVKKSEPSGGEGKRQRSPNKGKGTSGSSSSLALPNITEVTEDKWQDQEPPFTENTALVVKHAGTIEDSDDSDGDGQDIYDFFVNVDNVHLKAHQKASKRDTRVVRAQFVNAQVLIALSLIRGFGDDPKQEEEPNGEDQDYPIERLVETTTRAVAPVILPIVERIGAIGEEDVA
jgi:hypothetical protein